MARTSWSPPACRKWSPPEAFEAIQAADLIGWDGSVQHPRVLAYVGKICERLGQAEPRADRHDGGAERIACARAVAGHCVAIVSCSGFGGPDFVLADLRATWTAFANSDDSAAARTFLARVRGTAPGLGA